MEPTASNTDQPKSIEASPEAIESVKQQYGKQIEMLKYELCRAIEENVKFEEAMEDQADQIEGLKFKLAATEKMLGDCSLNADRQMAATRREFGQLKIQVSY